MFCSAATKDCRLIHGINPEYRKTLLEIKFLRLIHLEIFLKEFHLDDVQRNREAAFGDPKVKTSLTSEDGQNYGAIPMPIFASRRLIANSKHPVDIPQNYVVGQQRQQISELQFDKFPQLHHHFWCGKQDSKHMSQVVLIFRRKLCCGSQ